MISTTPRWNLYALVSLAFGVAALFTFGLTTLPALLFGFIALRQIHHEDGAQAGEAAARWGMILGSVGVLALLGGIGVMGLSRLRDRSGETVCRDNLRRLGLGLSIAHDERGHFPSGTIVTENREPPRRLSWQAALLPYMDPGKQDARWKDHPNHRGADLYARLDVSQAWDAPANQEAICTWMPWFECPGRFRRPGPGEPAPTSYLGIAGLGAEAPLVRVDDPRAGFFGYDRTIARDDITRGTSATLAAVESFRAEGPWAAGGPPTITSLLNEDRPYAGPGLPLGGLHPQGTLAVFADGHVNLIHYGAAGQVWEAHATILAPRP